MPQFLTTSGMSHLIEEVIIKAKSDLVLITPYLKLSRILFERLNEANRWVVRTRPFPSDDHDSLEDYAAYVRLDDLTR